MNYRFLICLCVSTLFAACTSTQKSTFSDDDLFIDPNITSMEYHQQRSQMRRQALLGQVRTLVNDEAPKIRGRGDAFEDRAHAVQASEYQMVNLPVPMQDEKLNDQFMSTDAGKFFMNASARFNTGNYQLAAEEYLLAFQYAKDNMLKSRSLYWLSECYYRSQEWNKAVQVFNFYQNEYLNDPLIPNIMLKKAFALEKLKRVIEAQQTYTDIVAKYPETQEARIAADQLQSPRASG